MDATQFKALAHFIKRINAMSSAKTKKYDVKDLSDKDTVALNDRLDFELSPEWLHCDGEISNEEAETKRVFFERVRTEIECLYYAEYPA